MRLAFTLGLWYQTKTPNPKASIATLAKALSDGKKDVGASIGKNTSDVLAAEISRYVIVHPDYENWLVLHALRARRSNDHW